MADEKLQQTSLIQRGCPMVLDNEKLSSREAATAVSEAQLRAITKGSLPAPFS